MVMDIEMIMENGDILQVSSWMWKKIVNLIDYGDTVYSWCITSIILSMKKHDYEANAEW